MSNAYAPSLKGKHVLSLAELKTKQIVKILQIATILKREKARGIFRPLLKNKSLAMIFQKPSTRTRVSFEVAMSELGGHALNLGASELQLARGETIEDTARTLSGYVDAIMARVYNHNDVVRLSSAARVPVINGLSDLYHPCQILADLLTIHEKKGRLRGLRLAWVGDGNNVCNTLLIGCSKVGINISVARPPQFRPASEAIEAAEQAASDSGASIQILEEPLQAVRGVDVVVTDTFVSMGAESEREQRTRMFLPKYQVTAHLMKEAKEDAIFMHCLPAHRGEEVAADVIDGPSSVVWQEAENRLHAQKALLCLLLIEEKRLPWKSLPVIKN